jgi:hypothetical protein
MRNTPLPLLDHSSPSRASPFPGASRVSNSDTFQEPSLRVSNLDTFHEPVTVQGPCAVLAKTGGFP